MQTISIPCTMSKDDGVKSDRLRLHQSRAIRSAYANAADLSEKELRDLLKTRFPKHPLGSWAIHCATREGRRLRKQLPNGKMVFGSRANLERRRKGLIDAAEWRRLRLRPIEIVGDRSYQGNRHFKLSLDTLRCEVNFLGEKITLRLPKMNGKQGDLVKAVAALAAAGEIAVQFSLGEKALNVTFDPMDLRRLTPGITLESQKAADLAALGKKAKGRIRKDPDLRVRTGVCAPIDAKTRPVHPEWRHPVPGLARRAIGLDLNPEWVRVSVIEIPESVNTRDADQLRILSHVLHLITIPIDAPREAILSAMAQIATQTISLARAWNFSTIWHEDGLGRLRWSKKSRRGHEVQTINYWSRNALLDGLRRRCALSGLTLSPIWGGYSSTIGNMLFELPDACAAATEIARRGIASARGEKDRLPTVPPRVHLRRWKDGRVPKAIAEAMAQAECWKDVHRTIKAAKTLGYRRLHPPLQEGSGVLEHDASGYAVNRLGCRKGHGCSGRPVLTSSVRDSSDRVKIA